MSVAPSVSRIAVFGGGQVALLAACGLARALPEARVMLIRTRLSRAALADLAASAMPSLTRFHARIGIGERMMLTRAGATHRLATGFYNWRADGAPFFVGYGAADDGAESWTGRSLDAADAVGHAGPATALAEQQLFAFPVDNANSPLADLDYALRFDPAAHAALLATLADRLRVAATTGDIAQVEREANAIRTVVLADGSRVEADLFVDATGPDAVLSGEATERVDWSAMLPVDRVAMPALPLAPATSVRDEVHALGPGYRMIAPGRDRTHVFACWSSRHANDGEDALPKALLEVDPAPVATLRPGRLFDPWQGNCIAIGDASAAFEPLQWLNLDLAVRQIELLLTLLPRQGGCSAEAAEYNRRAGMMADRMADFLAAHHWQDDRYHPTPILRARLDEYRRRGRLPPQEEDPIPREMWTQLLSGMGCGPGLSARVAAIDPDERAKRRAANQQRIASAVAAARPYEVVLRQMVEAR